MTFFKRLQKRKEDDTSNKRQKRSFVSASVSYSNSAMTPNPAAPANDGGNGPASVVPAQQRNILAYLDNEARKDLNSKVAMFFYETGIPFNVADTPAFKELISTTITWARENKHVEYQPPSSFPLRTTLLDRCDVEVTESIKVLFYCCCLICLYYIDTLICLQAITDHIEQFGGTLVSDGWSNCQGQPLLNLLVHTSQGPVFLFTRDSSLETKTADYIASVLGDGLKMIGPEKIYAVVTDSAANCKAAGEFM